ncbi:unnamed protein product [Owenia fusiformis]|uniref:Metalloendopeptidase n=1 Tax=Owenia fusiformis TaxID=6347 RepID=A0A8J1ULA5_OWEFU|nr:unnamed protein product [Owenia fusiformis]
MNPRNLLSAVGLVFFLAAYGVQTSEEVEPEYENEVQALKNVVGRLERIESYLGLEKEVEKEKEDEKEEEKEESGGASTSSEEEGEDEAEPEYGDKAGGDMAEDEAKVRAGAIATKMWPQGKVYYSIDAAKLTASTIANITKAMQIIQTKTTIGRAICIRFTKKTSMLTRNYIFITKKDGCWSKVGMKGGKQELSIGFGCSSTGTIMHELLHALGFFHEQARYDRDSSIIIHWKNIKPGWSGNFDMQPKGGIEKYKDSYDTESIMHYGPAAFTKGKGFKTIDLKKASNKVFGQRTHLSDQDIKAVSRMYKCTGTGSGIPADSSSTSSRTFASRTSSNPRTTSTGSRTASTGSRTASTGSRTYSRTPVTVTRPRYPPTRSRTYGRR